MDKCSSCGKIDYQFTIFENKRYCVKCYQEKLFKTMFLIDKLTFNRKIYTKRAKTKKGEKLRYFLEIPSKEIQFFNYKKNEMYKITIEKIK